MTPDEPGSPLQAQLEAQVLALLRQTIGSRVELHECHIANRHRDYLVLLCHLRRPAMEVVVKLAGPGAPLACRFERTAALHSLVAAQTSIPTPEVLAVDVSCQDSPWRYFIKTHVPGYVWAQARERMNAQQLPAAYRQMGEAVAQLHSIQFQAFGELTADLSVQADVPYLEALRHRAQLLIGQARLRGLFLSLLDQHAPLFGDVRRASLCHEDLHGHNILFHYKQGRWRLATILDFDKAWAGHGESDLARLGLWRGMTSPQFWSAYHAIHPVESAYAERRPIYQLLWCLEYARPTAEHLADTQRLCDLLGIPSIVRFD